MKVGQVLPDHVPVPPAVAKPRIVRWWRHGPENFIKLADRGVWSIHDDSLARLGLSKGTKVDAAELFATQAQLFQFVSRVDP